MKHYFLCLFSLIAIGIQAQSKQNVDPQIDQKINAAAENIEQQVIAWRRDFHQNPELSNREFETAKKIAAHLESLGMEVQTGVAKTGVVGILKGDN
ncbi:MAG TPA: amidohydrolase, partial [Gillisia sp.]|nr:amidohydrolase [Gillisia sp.]